MENCLGRETRLQTRASKKKKIVVIVAREMNLKQFSV